VLDKIIHNHAGQNTTQSCWTKYYTIVLDKILHVCQSSSFDNCVVCKSSSFDNCAVCQSSSFDNCKKKIDIQHNSQKKKIYIQHNCQKKKIDIQHNCQKKFECMYLSTSQSNQLLLISISFRLEITMIVS
jgi:hypothetical protein